MSPTDQALRIINTHRLCLYSVEECVRVMVLLCERIRQLEAQQEILSEARNTSSQLA